MFIFTTENGSTLTLGKRLKSMRQAQGKTLTEVAYKVGIPVSSLSLYESDKVTPPLEKLQSIAVCYGARVDDLLRSNDSSASLVSSISSEKDLIEQLLTLQDYEGIELKLNAVGEPVIEFSSEHLSAALKNLIMLKQLQGSVALAPEQKASFWTKNKEDFLRDLQDVAAKRKA